jgi:hypothetical protein
MRAQERQEAGDCGGLNWYRCIGRSWEESANLLQRVDQPALMITAELDPVLVRRWPALLQRVAEVAMVGALHDCLGARELHIALADIGDHCRVE